MYSAMLLISLDFFSQLCKIQTQTCMYFLWILYYRPTQISELLPSGTQRIDSFQPFQPAFTLISLSKGQEMASKIPRNKQTALG